MLTILIPKVAENFRPNILLKMTRKSLGVCSYIMERVKSEIHDELPSTQSAYRPEISTAENFFNMKLLISHYENYRHEVEFLSLGMPKAFNTLSRGKCLKMLESIVYDDEMRMIKANLCGTNMKIKAGNNIGESFHTNVGTLQGYALSPLLFAKELIGNCKEILKEMAYTDDEIFFGVTEVIENP